MNSRWKDFVESHSTKPEQAPACALCDLSFLGIISVTGEDAESFLQGQLTNDVRDVSESHWQMNSLCNPKGRMLCSFRLFKMGDNYYLQLPRENAQRLIKRLRMFVLMSKVTLSDVSDELVQIGLAGDCAESIINQQFTKLPSVVGGVFCEKNLVVLRLPGDRPRFELVGQVNDLIPLWEKFMSQNTSPADPEFWSLLDIRAGIPTITGSTAEAFVPQMTNMQLIDGLSFTKGCYTGQEIVARMKYLGKLKRRMYLAHVQSDIPPQPGEELLSSGSESGQGAGKVVSAAASPTGGYEMLTVVEIDSFERDDLHLKNSNGPKLHFRPLPYPFDDA